MFRDVPGCSMFQILSTPVKKVLAFPNRATACLALQLRFVFLTSKKGEK